jgi:CRP-like cAMP-binding protein
MDVLLAKTGTALHYGKRETIYTQGAASSAIFYIQSGMVMLTVRSKRVRPAVLSVLPAGSFFNEACLSKHTNYLSTATTLTPSSIIRVRKNEMVRLLSKQIEFADFFRQHLLVANMRFREDLLDVLINSARHRLARALLRLANMSSTGAPRRASIPQISQGALANMIGTTRSRVSVFMNQFRRSGFISYHGIIEVHSSLRRALTKG